MTGSYIATAGGDHPAEEHGPPCESAVARIVISFDVEEHFRIESASGLALDPVLKEHYGARVGTSTRWLLERLDRWGIKATFFVLGQVARRSPGLVRDIHRAGHEVASHGWDHQRVHALTPSTFLQDVQTSKDALEQITGEAVVGYRAPTFSIVRQTAWALDVLADLGLLYDSSIFPVRHDRYGVPRAPRAPFLAKGLDREILEIPPATLRIGSFIVPAGGGGYFRLLPLAVIERALAQARRACSPPVAMLYFHPWEFDPDQPRLPLRSLGRFRTYVGISRTKDRLETLLSRHQFTRADDVARRLGRQLPALARFHLAP